MPTMDSNWKDAAERQGSKEMPRYRSHKIVHALQIESVKRLPDGSALLAWVNQDYAPFPVSAAFVHKHGPQPGGYYIIYADGYQSFSPAEAFESGYTLLEGQ